MNEIVRWSDLSEAKLTSINLEITAHCNYTCDFCLNPSDQFRT
jgi:molybdenum cofactor biosynthesis enzyme MoaA